MLKNRSKIRIALGLSAVTLFAAALGSAQSANSKVAAPVPSYLRQSGIHPNARDVLAAIGKRLQVPGFERITYQCSYTDSNSTSPATFIWQLPGYVSLTISNNNKTYVLDPNSGLQNGNALSSSELNMLESLSSDLPEGFLYAMTGQGAFRFLGQRFRTDNGRTANYQGPWYDIFETVAKVAAQNNTSRQKFYYFDSTTKLLAQVQYKIPHGNSDTVVTTLYKNWMTLQSNMVPGQIVRQENGSTVFTLTVNSVTVQAQQNDAVFPAH
jgi:hypothetical protein